MYLCTVNLEIQIKHTGRCIYKTVVACTGLLSIGITLFQLVMSVATDE